MIELGMWIRLRFTRESPYPTGQTWLRNVTEIHWNYKGRSRVAFESNVHGTGITYDIGDIAEFETTPETEVAEAF